MISTHANHGAPFTVRPPLLGIDHPTLLRFCKHASGTGIERRFSLDDLLSGMQSSTTFGLLLHLLICGFFSSLNVLGSPRCHHLVRRFDPVPYMVLKLTFFLHLSGAVETCVKRQVRKKTRNVRGESQSDPHASIPGSIDQSRNRTRSSQQVTSRLR